MVAPMFDGVEHVAIASPNPPALAQCCGVSFLGKPYTAPHGHRLVFFSDCEGSNILHLIQRAHPLPE